MNNLNFLSVGDVGAFIADIPDDLMLSLNRQIKQIQNNFTDSKSYTDSLVGHIKHEYELEKTKELDNFINECVVEYNKKWPEYLDDVNVLSFDAPVGLYNSWVNFQKKYEFNPPHGHSGIFSFVIWFKIPYDLEEELNYFSNVHQGSKTSLFNFLYTDGLGKIKTYNVHVNKQFEGKICFFPAQLYHYVNPFYTSDEYRISVSGNVKLCN